MRRLSLALLLAPAVFAAAAHASPITAGTFNLTDTYVDGYQITGNVVLNSSGIVTSALLTLNDAALNDPTFTTVSSAGGPAGYNPVANYAYVSGIDGQIVLYYLTTFDSNGNIDLCINKSTCNSYQASYSQVYVKSAFGYSPVDLSSGTLDKAALPAATPEPSSLALLGTGILGAAVLLRSRRLRLNA